MARSDSAPLAYSSAITGAICRPLSRRACNGRVVALASLGSEPRASTTAKILARSIQRASRLKRRDPVG